ncbi:glycosyltransferase involved in cell wall biosynthesis [Lysobacter enzymogenes]|uniref:glycosyltransferase family 4 protein n=1 Tax=Lysobacter enzymogenes TaxID=69 RepID=UPI0033978DE8
MKLALVVPGGVDRGGESRVIPTLLALIARLARSHEVHVFALRQQAAPARWNLAGARVHNIGAGRTAVRAILAIRAEHRRAPFDLVQSIFAADCGLVAVAAARWLRRPGLVHVAGGELVSLPAIGYGGRRNWRGRLREGWVLRAADAVSAASAPMIEALRALDVDALRIPLGVDLHAWPPLAPRARRAGATARLLHIASLNRVKDQPTLLRALAALRRAGVEFRMDIVGADTLGGQMQALAQRLGLDGRVAFLGFRTQRELRPLVEAADLLVLSSLHEAGPLVLLEAAVAGVPTVGTAVGHLCEWAPQAALAVASGDSAALAEALRQVLADEALRLRLAWEAHRRALREDASHTALAFERLHAQVCASRGRA